MKRIIAGILCLMVLLTLPLTASAAGASMRISASSGTATRGETITLTVTLSNSEPVSNGGIILNYDSSAFELVGGSLVVNGAQGEVSASIGGGVFSVYPDAVVSGSIFTIILKVKSDAPFGKYSISGSSSLKTNSGDSAVSCSVSGTGITVVCSHSFGQASKVDDGSHKSTCSICGETKTESHNWDSGTVDKAATCKDTGVKKLKCTACGATKNETIPVNNDHKYGSFSKVDGSKHTHKCSVCGKQETLTHTWNSGKVTKQATCTEEGSKELTCTGCKATKTEVVKKTDHSFTPWEKVDDSGHSRKCTVCDKQETGSHTADDVWEHDENGHFQECVCGHISNWEAHVPGPEPTETTDQLCTVCSRLLKPNTAHEHVYDASWTIDEVGHWHKCTQCDEKDSFATHAFEDECDVDCNVCGLEREAPHVPGEIREADGEGHWFPCKLCGEKANFAAHTPGPAATTSTPQNCAVCGFELAPVLPHDHVYDHQGSSHAHACACGETYLADALTCDVCLAENKPFPWWIVCIGEAVVFGGIIVFLLVKTKKKRESVLGSED